MSDAARRYPGDARRAFVAEARATDGERELDEADDVDLANRGAAYCARLAETGSSLKAVFALQLAGETHPGDVYVTAAARRHLCPDLPDTESSPGRG